MRHKFWRDAACPFRQASQRAFAAALKLKTANAIGLALCAFTLIGAPHASAQAQPRQVSLSQGITVSLISPRGVERTREDWSAFIADMSKALKMPVNLRIGKTQREVVADMLEGRADMAWMGNAPALEVVEAGVGEVFAAMVRQDGGTGYRSVIVVHKDSPIKTLGELLDAKARHTFAAGDPNSTSGYVVPNYYVFARNKVRPEALFSKIIQGNHAENALRVARREVDAGTCNDSELAVIKQRNPTERANLRVLWQSVEIPESPMMWRNTMDPALKARVRTFFANYGSTPQQQATLLKINGLKRFRPSSNRQLLVIADIEMFNARTQIERNVSLSLDEKGSKHQDVVQRAVRLETALRL